MAPQTCAIPMALGGIFTVCATPVKGTKIRPWVEVTLEGPDAHLNPQTSTASKTTIGKADLRQRPGCSANTLFPTHLGISDF